MEQDKTPGDDREYMARAAEAEKRATELRDPYLKASWERIAAGYRQLAAKHGRLN